MFLTLQVLSVCLVAVAMSLALAHALELPGKMRLHKEAYLATQPIYYPGFTVAGGIGEAGGMVTTLILLLLTPHRAENSSGRSWRSSASWRCIWRTGSSRTP
jgi:hypothetical protein